MFASFVGYRTYIAAALVGIFGVLSSVDWNHILDNPSGLVAVGASVLMAVLRSITTTPPMSNTPVTPPDKVVDKK